MELLSNLFTGLLLTSGQCSILIMLILFIRKCTPQKHSMKLCSALWMLLIIKMIMPWAPESGLSMFNLFQIAQESEPMQALQTARIEFPDSASTIDVTAEQVPVPNRY